MTDHRKNGPINIPIESDVDDVFEIDGDAVDIEEEIGALAAEPALEAETSLEDDEHHAEVLETSTTNEIDANVERVDEPMAEEVEEGEAVAEAHGEATTPFAEAVEGALDDGVSVETDDEPFDAYIPPPTPVAPNTPIGSAPMSDAPFASPPEDEVAAHDSSSAKQPTITREAVFEMMQELRQKSEQISRMTDEKSDLMDRLLRKQAEFENFRKRGEREMHEAYVRARADLLGDLLPVLDNLDLALQHADSASPDVILEGVQLIYKQLMDTLARLGLETIEAEGLPFDPELHDAVATEPNEEVPDHTVVGVLQRGFKLGDRMLRPARVKVAVQP